MFKKTKKTTFNFIRKYKTLILLAIYSLVLFDVFILNDSNDLRFYGVIIAYLLTVFISKTSSKISFLFCIFLVILMYAFYLAIGPKEITEEIAVWFVLFFVAGLIKLLREK